MTKEELNQMCREYQQVLVMSETEVQSMKVCGKLSYAF